MAKVIKLKNGAVLLYSHNNQSKATAFRVGIFRGGYLDKNTGISHLLEHMLFKGTKNCSNDQLSALIRDNTRTINASTSGDYMLIRAYESNKKLKDAFKLTADMLINSNFPSEELEKEKQVVKQEIIRANDDIQRKASKNLLISAYNYPEIKSSVLGDEKKMMAITRKDLLKYQENNIVCENFFASCCSSLPAFVIKRLVNKYFIKNLKSGIKNEFNSSFLSINGKSKLVVEPMERQKIVLKVAIPTFGYSNLKDNFLLGQLLNYFSGIKGPIFNHFREKKQLVYAVSLNRWAYRDDGLLVFDIETSKDKINDCFVAISDFIKDAKQGIEQHEVDRLLEKIEEREDCYIGHPVDSCANIIFNYLDHNKIIKSREYLKNKKYLTKKTLDELINQVFTFDKVFVSVAGPVTKKEIPNINKIISIIKQ